jgi:hypothetical protein
MLVKISDEAKRKFEAFERQRDLMRNDFEVEFNRAMAQLWAARGQEAIEHIEASGLKYAETRNFIFLEVEAITLDISMEEFRYSAVRCWYKLKFLTSSGTQSTQFSFHFLSQARQGDLVWIDMFDDSECVDREDNEEFACFYHMVLSLHRFKTLTHYVFPESKRLENNND